MRKNIYNEVKFYFLGYYLLLICVALGVKFLNLDFTSSSYVLYWLYSLLFLAALSLGVYLLIKRLHEFGKIDFKLFAVLLLIVLVFFIKVKTSFFIDARPTATLPAIYGGHSKHSYALMFFWRVLSWIKHPAFNDILLYNMFLGSIVLLLCYLYFSLVTHSKSFGFLCFIFLSLSSLFYQATISSEYFLIQLVFVFCFFIIFHYFKKNPSHVNILLLFLLYSLLILSKVEAFILIGMFPFLLLVIRKDVKLNITFFLYFYLFTLLMGIIMFFLLEDKVLINSVLDKIPLFNVGIRGYGKQYLYHCWRNILTIFRQFPSESISVILLIVISLINPRINKFDLSAALVIFIPIFIICFFIHDEGFCHQEGGIKFSFQMIFIFLYLWAVLMWNLIKLLQKQKIRIIKIGIFSLILFLNIPHLFNSYAAIVEYNNLIRYIKKHPLSNDVFNKVYSPHVYLNDSFVYKIKYIVNIAKDERIRVGILDFDMDDSIFNYVIRPVYKPVLYISANQHRRGVKIQAPFTMLEKSDWVIIIEHREGDMETSKHLIPSLAGRAKVILYSYDRLITVIGVSEQGALLLKKTIFDNF